MSHLPLSEPLPGLRSLQPTESPCLISAPFCLLPPALLQRHGMPNDQCCSCRSSHALQAACQDCRGGGCLKWQSRPPGVARRRGARLQLQRRVVIGQRRLQAPQPLLQARPAPHTESPHFRTAENL
jgi:hypothetical protein